MQAVLDAPEADAPRLAYAKVLDERGDPRGELIRVQIDLANLVKAHGGPSYGALLRRRDELLREFGAAWGRGIPSFVRGHVFLRGFVDQVKVDPRALGSHAKELFSTLPVLHLDLEDASGGTAALAGCSQLGQVVSLNFWGNGIGDDDVEALVASPHLGHLRWLELGRNQLTRRGLEALCRTTNLPQLRWVGLAKNQVDNPTDRPVAVEDDWIIEFGSTELAAALEAEFGPKRWLHYQTPNPRFFPPERQEFVGVQ